MPREAAFEMEGVERLVRRSQGGTAVVARMVELEEEGKWEARQGARPRREVSTLTITCVVHTLDTDHAHPQFASHPRCLRTCMTHRAHIALTHDPLALHAYTSHDTHAQCPPLRVAF